MRGKQYITAIFFLISLSLLAWPAGAGVEVQCPGDTNGDAQWTGGETQPPNTSCMHITGGDGFAKMADGSVIYIFGFKDVTGVLPGQTMLTGELGANTPAPTIRVKEGEDFYLTLSNVGMKMRPDLFDPHTVHFHGYPNAAPIFDGEPMAAISINQGSSLTYYYKGPVSGTYMFHCHVEATEHMQMGMLGSLYVTPKQDGTSLGGYTKFAYNDGDGSTGYDADFPIQLIGFDPNFHDEDLNIQPLSFAAMADSYMLLNGRGYPDTINPSTTLGAVAENNFKVSQPVPSRIEVQQNKRLLLRVSNLSTVHFTNLTLLGIPMKVVGKDAMILRGTGGSSLYYETNSIMLGGGQSADIILDTTGVQPGTYFLYTAKLNELSNNQEDFGGPMTEILVTP